MNILRYILLSLLVICALAFTGCERKYDNPSQFRVYEDKDFVDRGEVIVPIQKLIDEYHNNVSTVNNHVEGYEIKEDWVIKGKVISTDEFGNVYRTLYIRDASVASTDDAAAIEIKTGLTGFYNYFRPGETIYVRCKGLYLGNYRYMISVGGISTDPDEYSNGFIDVKMAFTNEIDRHSNVLQGALTKPEKADTVVFKEPVKEEVLDRYLGRLVRFENAVYTEGRWNNNDYPSFLETIYSTVGGESLYINHNFRTAIELWKEYYGQHAIWEESGKEGPEPKEPTVPKPGSLVGPTWALKNTSNQDNFHGSALFKFGSSDDIANNLIVRTSGYAKFANDLLPESGTRVDLTGILTKYCSKGGGFPAYQVVLNKVSDVKIEEE